MQLRLNVFWRDRAMLPTVFWEAKQTMYQEQKSNMPKYVLTGTTTMGVVCKDGIVLGTDTRATLGTFVAHKKAKKVFPIDDHVAMTIAGGVADAQSVVEMLRANSKLYKFEKGLPIPISAIARLAANVLFSARYYPFILQSIIGGMDDQGAHIFALDPLGSVTEEKCVSTGSGSPVAYGVLEPGYKEGMSIKEAIPLVVRAVNSAMKRDSASGDSFDVAVISKDGYRELNEEEKRSLSPAS
jgi:proteasome beta subunit